MIAAAMLDDQYLPVGAKRSLKCDSAVERRHNLGSRAGFQHQTLRSAAGFRRIAEMSDDMAARRGVDSILRPELGEIGEVAVVRRLLHAPGGHGRCNCR